MPKLIKKVRSNEGRYDKMHKEFNMMIGPARKEDLPGSYPVYIIPNLDPMQEQINRIESAVNYESRCARRRAWKASVTH